MSRQPSTHSLRRLLELPATRWSAALRETLTFLPSPSLEASFDTRYARAMVAECWEELVGEVVTIERRGSVVTCGLGRRRRSRLLRCALRSDSGELLTWFGPDLDFEEKHRKWEASDRSDREPEKFHFVKGFHKGLELYGQHVLRDEGTSEKLKGLGLIVVEGPNDVIRLDTLGVPVVGLCGNTISEEQADKAASLARTVGGGVVTLMLDLDDEGRKGLMQCLEHLAQRTPVRVAWSTKMYGGKFKGRQPETLSNEEWSEILRHLAGR